VNRVECEPELTFTEAADNENWGADVSRTNFAQDWACKAKEAEKGQKPEAQLPEEYQRHTVVFSEEAAKQFPPSQPEDHAIKLKPGASQEINCKVYPLTRQELKATRKLLDNNLALEFIEECTNEGSPWSTPWFFTGKKDRGL
jgi:hypothetical protein